MGDKWLNANEIAARIGVSVQTLSLWYRFKNENPDNEYAKMLPDFERNGKRQTRYWEESCIEALMHFKKAIPEGRNGVMGSVTQKYVSKSGNESDAYIEKIHNIMKKNNVDDEKIETIIGILKKDYDSRKQKDKGGKEPKKDNGKWDDRRAVPVDPEKIVWAEKY